MRSDHQPRMRFLHRCLQEAGHGQPERWETVLQESVYKPRYSDDPSYGGYWEWQDVPTVVEPRNE
jgi:hypothetical protein